MINIMIEPIKKYSNFIQRCPYSAGNFTAIKLQIDGMNYPAFIPAADYRVDIRLFNEKNQTIILIRSFLLVQAKGIHQLLVG